MNLFAWGVIFFLIAANALYVAAEFAAVSVRHGQIRTLAQNGYGIARRMLPMLEDARELDRYIATCQIGITLSSLILGAFAQATIALDLGALLQNSFGLETATAFSTSALVVLVLLTGTQVVFGELVPKSLALQFPSRVSLYTYLPTYWSSVLYRPFISVLNGSGWVLLKGMGLSPTGGHRHVHSPEEIEMLLAESRDGGLLEPDEQDRLHRALQLSRRTARQLMVPRRQIEAIEISQSPEEVLHLITNSPYTRLPVYRESIDDVIGLLHTKDVAAHVARHGRLTSIQPLLRPIASLPAETTADKLLALLREKRTRQAVVFDEYGGVQGIVTLEDVLIELVGEVADEFKEEDPAPEPLSDGRVRVPGQLRLDEVAPWTGGLWEDEVSETVGGRVVAALGYIPEGGERLSIEGVDVEVERVEGHTITSLLVTPYVASADEQAAE